MTMDMTSGRSAANGQWGQASGRRKPPQRLNKRWGRSSTGRREQRSARRRFLRFESLEDRSLLATYHAIANGDWNNAATWTGGPTGTFPGVGDTARIGGGFNVTIAVGRSEAAADVVVGFDAGTGTGFGNGTLNFGAGAVALAVSNSVTLGAVSPSVETGTLSMIGGGTLHVGAAFTLSSGTSTFNAGSGTIDYNGSGAQTVAATTYNNLT